MPVLSGTVLADPSLSEEEKKLQRKIAVEVPVRIYEEFIIPLTKDIELEYLLQRPSNSLRMSYLGQPGSFCHIAMQHVFPSGDGYACQTEKEVGVTCR